MKAQTSTEQLDPPIIDDPFVRLIMVRDREQFLPVNLNELTEALSLGSYPARQGGAARHLNEILLHQKKAETDDPNRAVRSVATEYVSYYRSAKLGAEQLTVLSEDVREVYNPNLSLDMALGLDHVGLAGMVRFMDLRKVASQQYVKDGEINPLLIDYTDQRRVNTMRYIANILKNLRIGDIRSIVPLSLEDQKHRSNFWHERLVESSRHATARPIVERALKQ
jgi:hypothetical protein